MHNSSNTITPDLVVLLGALSALAAISTDIYLPALSSIASSLNANNAQVQITLGIFFIGYGFGQLLFGPLSDSLGRKPVLLIGLYCYTAASVACALSTHIDFLISSRFLQALGGCAAAVSTRAIVRDCSEGEGTTRILNKIMAIVQIAPLVAPLVGGVIILLFPWQGVFLALSLYGLVSIICAHLWVNESHPIHKRQKMQLSNLLAGYVETLSNINIALLLAAEVAISICLLTFVTGSSRLFSQYYGLSPLGFGVLFAFVTSALLFGSFLHSRLLKIEGVNYLIKLFLTVGLFSAAGLLIIAISISEKIFVLIIGVWFSLLPCIALRASFVSIGLQYMPERTGTVSGLFGAFGLGVGGIIAIVIGHFDHFSPLLLAAFILTGYLAATVFYGIWKALNKQRETAQ